MESNYFFFPNDIYLLYEKFFHFYSIFFVIHFQLIIFLKLFRKKEKTLLYNSKRKKVIFLYDVVKIETNGIIKGETLTVRQCFKKCRRDKSRIQKSKRFSVIRIGFPVFYRRFHFTYSYRYLFWYLKYVKISYICHSYQMSFTEL